MSGNVNNFFHACFLSLSYYIKAYTRDEEVVPRYELFPLAENFCVYHSSHGN